MTRTVNRQNDRIAQLIRRSSIDNIENVLARKSTPNEIMFLKSVRDPGNLNLMTESNDRIGRLLEMNKPLPKNKENFKFPDIKIEFSESFLESLYKNEEIFVIKQNSLYTLGFPSKISKKVIRYNGVPFSLRESEDVRILENIFYEVNKNEIERFKSELVKKLSNEESRINSGFSRFREGLETGSLKKEVLNEIVNYSKVRRIIPEEKPVDNEEKINFDDFRNVQFAGDNSVFSRVFGKLNNKKTAKEVDTLVGIFGNFYSVYSGNNLEIDLNEISNYRNEDFNELNGFYVKELEKNVKDRTGEAFEGAIREIERKKINLDSLKDNPIMSNSSVKLREINQNKFILYKEIPEFIIHRKNMYALFNAAKLATTIDFNNEKVKIGVPGFVLDNKSYYHPFSNGELQYGKWICHGSFNEWGVLGIHHGWQELNFSKKRELAYQVHAVLDKLEQVLTLGCKGDFIPGIDFHPDNFSKVEIKKEYAEQMHREKGVRIYDNS